MLSSVELVALRTVRLGNHDDPVFEVFPEWARAFGLMPVRLQHASSGISSNIRSVVQF